MTAKELIKRRNLRFLHPSIVAKSDEENVASILKAVGYFRNFAIFKNLYTLLYKGKNLSLDRYRIIVEDLKSYKQIHPKDFFIDGFSVALAKSEAITPEVKAVFAVLVYNQLYKDGTLFDHIVNKTGKKLSKVISDYYEIGKPINAAIIRKSKVLKIDSGNIVKSVSKWTFYMNS
jgi:hypothetical protein